MEYLIIKLTEKFSGNRKRYMIVQISLLLKIFLIIINSFKCIKSMDYKIIKMNQGFIFYKTNYIEKLWFIQLIFANAKVLNSWFILSSLERNI